MRLSINKTKLITASKENENIQIHIEQVDNFKYLSLVIHHNGKQQEHK